jgi:hypothetical protein
VVYVQGGVSVYNTMCLVYGKRDNGSDFQFVKEERRLFVCQAERNSSLKKQKNKLHALYQNARRQRH